MCDNIVDVPPKINIVETEFVDIDEEIYKMILNYQNEEIAESPSVQLSSNIGSISSVKSPSCLSSSNNSESDSSPCSSPGTKSSSLLMDPSLIESSSCLSRSLSNLSASTLCSSTSSPYSSRRLSTSSTLSSSSTMSSSSSFSLSPIPTSNESSNLSSSTENNQSNNNNDNNDNGNDNNNDNNNNDNSLRQQMGAMASHKAGLQNVDIERVSQIIYETTIGTPFFTNETRKNDELNSKLKGMLKKYEKLKEQDLTLNWANINQLIKEFERKRDLSRIIVHIDMDAFYASVEEKDNPGLHNQPMAVGDESMLCTANYEARKYGVRSAMPGFIAKKLCPELIIIPVHFEKYYTVSSQIRKIFKKYDTNFYPISLDEAYLDLTEHLRTTDKTPDDLVKEIRDEIYKETNLTSSAGIAANMLLAKICANINKPNGQFRIQNDRSQIIEFIRNLPVRKVNGIGRVTEALLHALGIKTMGDAYFQLAYIRKLFTPCSFEFIMQASIGIGSTSVKFNENHKSMGVSRTFVPLSKPQDLLAKFRQLTDLLEFELKKEDLSGRTVTLYFKSTTFEVKSRSRTIPRYIFESDDLYYFGKQILEAELPMKIRSLGIRLSTLRPQEVERRCGIKRFFKVLVNEQDGYNNKQSGQDSLQAGPSIKKQRVKTLIKEPITNITKITEITETTEITDNNKAVMPSSDTQRLNTNWDCPGCQKVFNNPSILRINSHLDNCLNRINTKQQNPKVIIKNNNLQQDNSLFNYFGRR
ncbi:hypothetical protein Glove_402g13 [Diversispora epigaea]|uniref:DNA polymerase kappa n=1 Tax=Diversispora epigaea TaxID=1348612 RepID=A0A397H0X6_9GLOM|nr:hypothetical protein Glove_402g13 [Diversispora epigaea]